VGVLTDLGDGVAQLIEGAQILGEGGLGADLLGVGAFGDAPVVDAAGQPVQRGPDGGASTSATLVVGSARPARPMVSMPSLRSLSSATGPMPHSLRTGKTRPATLLLGAPDHPDAVPAGQSGGDLGDLLARPGAHRRRSAA
jgi:hypothetical protein